MKKPHFVDGFREGVKNYPLSLTHPLSPFRGDLENLQYTKNGLTKNFFRDMPNIFFKNPKIVDFYIEREV